MKKHVAFCKHFVIMTAAGNQEDATKMWRDGAKV